jgi:outer membrane receptor for ferrienterochelin and colicin
MRNCITSTKKAAVESLSTRTTSEVSSSTSWNLNTRYYFRNVSLSSKKAIIINGEFYTQNLSQNWQINYFLNFQHFLIWPIKDHICQISKKQKKHMESSQKNKQGSIGIKINPMLPYLFFHLDSMVHP